MVAVTVLLSCCDAPASLLHPLHDSHASDTGSAWSTAAAIAAEAVSSTLTAQRHLAKERLRSHLKSIAPLEWPALCGEALQWVQCQVRLSSGSGGLVAAACALIDENSHRNAAAAQSLTNVTLSSTQAADPAEFISPPAAVNLMLGLFVAREVAPSLC